MSETSTDSDKQVQDSLPLSWESENDISVEPSSPKIILKKAPEAEPAFILKRAAEPEEANAVVAQDNARNINKGKLVEDDEPDYSLDEGAGTGDVQEVEATPAPKVILKKVVAPVIKPVEESKPKPQVDTLNVTVGEALKEARHRLDLPLEEVAKATKIQNAYIKALESDNFDELPDNQVFQTQYLRVLCREYELDTETIIQRYRKQSGNESPVPGKLMTTETADLAEQASSRPGGKWMGKTLIVALVIVLAVVGYGFVKKFNTTDAAVEPVQLEDMDFSKFKTPQKSPAFVLPVPQ